MADTEPGEGRTGGLWTVSCTCGWERTGRYTGTHLMAEYSALRIANSFGTRHEENPGEARDGA